MKIHIYILTLLLVLVSCNKEDDEKGILRPTLSATDIELQVGESAVISVLNADGDIAAEAENNEIIDIFVSGEDITVTALKTGETVINITAGLRQLQCMVVVTLSEQSEYDFEKEYQDKTSRYVSPTMSLRYDTPGIIFSITENRKIEIIDLSSDCKVKFAGNMPFQGEGIIENVTLEENGEKIDIAIAEIKRISATEIWLLITTPTADNIILVLADI